jgi:hypothetical protein
MSLQIRQTITLMISRWYIKAAVCASIIGLGLLFLSVCAGIMFHTSELPDGLPLAPNISYGRIQEMLVPLYFCFLPAMPFRMVPIS